MILFNFLVAVAGLVSVIFVLFIIAGGLVNHFHGVGSDDTPVSPDRYAIAITTIAAEHVEGALLNTIETTVSTFPEYEVYVVLDEGSDLQDELVNRTDVTAIVVPDEYTCRAEAKGRAINYFIESVVEDDMWYSFIDDDNIIRDRKILCEIPYYERRGYVASNPVLVPRRGDSVITYLADGIRWLDDVTVFRTFTGLLGRPYVGFHGELLTVKGKTLNEVTFNRESIVEDLVFANELVKRDDDVWQSQTRVSVLSPHNIQAFLKQRRRWYTGIVSHITDVSRPVAVLSALRAGVWSVSFTGSMLIFPLLLAFSTSFSPVLAVFMTFGGVVYSSVVVYTAYKDSLKTVPYAVFIPVCALIEHIVPVYSLLKRNSSFVVIEK